MSSTSARVRWRCRFRRGHVFVKLQTTAASVGVSNAPLPSWSYETTESITTTMRNYIAPLLIGHDPLNHNEIHHAHLRCIETRRQQWTPVRESRGRYRLHDLRGKLLGVPVHTLSVGKRHDACRSATP